MKKWKQLCSTLNLITDIKYDFVVVAALRKIGDIYLDPKKILHVHKV